ncbi:MAG: hypothetical protein QNJ97_22460 [Myxococcota bacterium]|nr:hypothetical protein [Myxococcota bacterium]
MKLFLALFAAVAAHVFLSRLIPDPWASSDLSHVVIFLTIQGVGFCAYLVAVARVLRCVHQFLSLKWIIAGAVLFRLMAIAAEPLFDDDIYRYIWDGKAVVNGFNPYQYAPEEVVMPPFDQMAGIGKVPEAVSQMAVLDRLNDLWFEDQDETALFRRINYPQVPTIYPPVAQAVFALAYAIAPGPMLLVPAFKLIFAALDMAVIPMLISILRRLGQDPRLCLIYGWHPMVIKEIAGTGHMEAVPIVLTVLALYLFIARREVAALSTLSLAMAAKLFPVLLFPIFAARLWQGDRRKLFVGSAVAIVIATAAYLPFLAAGERIFSGTSAFAGSWEMNAGPFALIQWIAGTLSLEQARLIARSVSILAMVGIVLFAAHRAANTRLGYIQAAVTVMGGAFLLSPVQNPWYLAWALPFVCLVPRWSWLILSATTTLYYLYFAMASSPVPFRFLGLDPGPLILAAQSIPFFVLLYRELWAARHAKATVGAACG